jgi:hypothetical protein
MLAHGDGLCDCVSVALDARWELVDGFGDTALHDQIEKSDLTNAPSLSAMPVGAGSRLF